MLEIAKSFGHVFAMMAPWLVFGFLMAGVIAVWIPRNWVNRMMGGRSGFGGVLRAVAIGVPLPICSCGVLPIATGLRKHGAGKGPTAALLVSTPQTGIDSILATYALMGPVFAVARPVAAALTGIVGGVVVAAVGGEDAESTAVEDAPVGSRGIKAIFWQAYRRLLGSVAKPLAIGLAISALVTVLVPDNFFADAFHGSDWIAVAHDRFRALRTQGRRRIRDRDHRRGDSLRHRDQPHSERSASLGCGRFVAPCSWSCPLGIGRVPRRDDGLQPDLPSHDGTRPMRLNFCELDR